MKKSKILLFPLFMLILILTSARGQDNFNKEDLVHLLGANNSGTDFWMTFHPNYNQASEIYIYIASEVETLVTLEIPGRGYKVQKMSAANGVVVFDLTTGLAQPFVAPRNQPPPPEAIYVGYGIHVYTNDPIVCYGVSKSNGTSDGFLALPSQFLGTSYVVASWGDTSNNTNMYLPSYTSIIALYDRTQVQFTLGGTTYTKTRGGMTPGQTKSWDMYRGDVLVFASSGFLADLTGSLIQSTKPLAVFSGNMCAEIPESAQGCDYLIEQEMPVHTWGKYYMVSPITKRTKNSMIKIFASQPGTVIYRNGYEIAKIKTFGGTESDGWVKMRAMEGSPQPVTISGSQPISVTQYNNSRGDDNVSEDPFQINLIPLEQFQKEIYFSTPGIAGSSKGFPTNYINIIYQGTGEGTIPDDLLFGKINGELLSWMKIKDFDPTPGKAFPLQINGVSYFSKTVLLPDEGFYKIKADNPIGLYSYGFSSIESYGFPSSVTVKDLTKDDKEPPKPTYKMQCNGTIDKAAVEDYPQNPASRSNLSTIYYNPHESNNYTITIKEFIPGTSTSTTWEAEVNDITNEAKAVITFSDRCGNDTTITINYYPYRVALNQGNVDLGIQRLGGVYEQDVWIVNNSEYIASNVKFLRFKSGNQGFQVLDENSNDLSLPININSKDSIKIKVRFTASAIGNFADSLGLGDSCTFNYTAYVHAKVGGSIIQVSSVDFGKVVVGSNAINEFDIKNTGEQDLIISSYNGPSQPTIFFTGLPDISEAKPLTIKANQRYTYEVRFKPTEEKMYYDTIYFHSNSLEDSSLDSTMELFGEGFKPQSVDEISKNESIYLFPNPAGNTLNIILNNYRVAIFGIRIFDIYGQLAISAEPFSLSNGDDGKYSVNISHLPAGIYYLQIIGADKVKTAKFTILR